MSAPKPPFADGQNVGLPSDRTQVGFALQRGGGGAMLIMVFIGLIQMNPDDNLRCRMAEVGDWLVSVGGNC